MLNPRTLALRLTALSQWHLHQGFPDPTSTLNVGKTLSGIRFIKRAQLLGFTLDEISSLLRLEGSLACSGTRELAA